MLNGMKRLARDSRHLKSKHCTVILKGGKVLSIANNSKRMHSEVRALRRVSDSKRQNLIAWTLRVGKSNQLMLGRPCLDCLKYLQENGVKRIYFSLDDGNFGRIDQ